MKNILIIADHLDETLDLEELFLKNGFKIFMTLGLGHGVEIAIRYIPDLIISDFDNQHIGIELIKKLRDYELTNTIPLICLSSNSDFENQRYIMNLGVDDYILKPFSFESLLTAVNARFNKYRLLKEKMMQFCKESLEAENDLPQKDDHILIKIGKRLELVRYNRIVCITALKEYSKIRTFNGENIIVRKSLKTWTNILPAKEFLRIHRSTIINIEAIEKIKQVKERSYIVYLKTIKSPFDLSQRYSNIMRKTFPS